MVIERTSDQILLRISANVDKFGIQRILDYIEYLELTSKSGAMQKDADDLAEELNRNWWQENRDRFIQ